MENILILSAGTRNKIVRYFKDALKKETTPAGKVIAADMSIFAPALYEADKFYQVPPMAEAGYMDIILDICQKERITGVLSLIDPELSLLAANEERFREVGTTVLGSGWIQCERALDKLQMYDWLKAHGYPTAKSYPNKESFYLDAAQGKISYPVFVKPVCGSASLSVQRAEDKETIEHMFRRTSRLMIQEYMKGQEIGADVYIDLISGETVSIFTKKKLLMRAGETDKSISFQDPKLFRLIERFCGEFGFRGPIDMDLFALDGEYCISEVNPRFGGGYPHAHECGCNHVKLAVKNLAGERNRRQIGAYEEGVCMMKFGEVAVRKCQREGR